MSEPLKAAQTPGDTIVEPTPARRRSSGRWKATPALWTGAVLTGIFVLMALVAASPLAPYDPVGTNLLDRLLPPGAVTAEGTIAWLGTDQVGRDILGQIISGAQVSVTVGLGTVLLAGIVGTILGLIAGYVGGWIGRVIMLLVDLQLAFPGILLAIFIASILGPSIWNVIFTLAITRWVAFARVARSIALESNHLAYVQFADFSGAGLTYILRRHIFPNAVTSLVVLATVEFGYAIVAEAALSFLGLGVGANTASWGLTISAGRNYVTSAWWISTFAGVALSLLMIGVGLLGDELRRRLDPRA